MNAASAALLAETRRRPGRLLLTGLAVTVATVFAAGALLLGETMRSYLTATSVQDADRGRRRRAARAAARRRPC
ncbi:hypothetical protein [Pseudonocardia asaccharolytica]|uniref:hypothetical protein n=1 Tax=Pseudonocardia asaccharolytica TaxID=54010 RepID=UPI000409FBFA|nr:hypothetical protein [Pseudonocardia asaccharolytica]